jgi:hypothetical protein
MFLANDAMELIGLLRGSLDALRMFVRFTNKVDDYRLCVDAMKTIMMAAAQTSH